MYILNDLIRESLFWYIVSTPFQQYYGYIMTGQWHWWRETEYLENHSLHKIFEYTLSWAGFDLTKLLFWFGFMVFNATFNNISVISWRSVLLMEETGEYKLYHIILYRVHLSWMGFEITALLVTDTDCIGSCKSNYHTITTTTVPTIRLWRPEFVRNCKISFRVIELKFCCYCLMD